MTEYERWKIRKKRAEDYVRKALKLCLVVRGYKEPPIGVFGLHLTVRGCKKLERRKLLSMADLEEHLKNCPDCQKRMVETKLPNCINSSSDNSSYDNEEPFD